MTKEMSSFDQAEKIKGRAAEKIARVAIAAGVGLAGCTPTLLRPNEPIETPSQGQALAIGLLNEQSINNLPDGEVKTSFVNELNDIKKDCAEITGCLSDTIQIYRVNVNDPEEGTNVFSYHFANIDDSEGLRTQILSVTDGKTQEKTEINEDLVAKDAVIEGIPTRVFGYVDDNGNSHYLLVDREVGGQSQFQIYDAEGTSYDVITQNEKEVQAYSSFWGAPGIVEAVAISNEEIPVDQIKLDENSFIPTGEYPKDGSELILLKDEYIGEAAKEVVIKNGLGEQAKAIEKVYQSGLDRYKLYSSRIPEGTTLSFTYLVSAETGKWTIVPILNGFGVSRVCYSVLAVKDAIDDLLTQNEILNIALNGTNPDNLFIIDIAMPVGFGFTTEPSYFVDKNGNFVIGIPDKDSGKPFVWYNKVNRLWQTDISVAETYENEHLQKNIDLWMRGKISISDDEKFKDGDNIAPLGHVDVGGDMSIYQGVSLGVEIYDGVVIAYFGFEDNNRNRYYMPVSLGGVDSETTIIGVSRANQREIALGSNRDVESLFSPVAAGEALNKLEFKSIGVEAFGLRLKRECQEETIPDNKNLCEKQIVITESLPGLFDRIAKYGVGGAGNQLVNGRIGKNGLDLYEVPLINTFRILRNGDS